MARSLRTECGRAEGSQTKRQLFSMLTLMKSKLPRLGERKQVKPERLGSEVEPMRGPHLDPARPAYIKPLDLDARDICSARRAWHPSMARFKSPAAGQHIGFREDQLADPLRGADVALASLP